MELERTAFSSCRYLFQVSTLVLGFGSVTAAGTEADLVFKNAAVYTVDDQRSWASAIAVDSGRIVAVGDDNDVAPWIGRGTRLVDLNGKMVLPAFGDAHIHPYDYDDCDLANILDRQELLAKIVRCGEGGDAEEWVTGGRWEGYVFENGTPDKSILDGLLPGRPVFLRHAHGHAAWVSSRAFEIAGITKDTPDPPNGRIDRDPESGEPTGLVHESAMDLISAHIPPPTHEEKTEALRRAIAKANQFGITSIQDAGTDRSALRAYAALAGRNDFNARAVTTVRIKNSQPLEDIERILDLRREFDGTRFRVTAVKIGLDGVLYQHTAPLLEPYTDRPDLRVEPHIDPDTLNEVVARLDAYGFQIHIHAVGDYTVRIALDAFEHAREVNGIRDSRHHIAHMDLIHPDDRKRFAELDVVANFQPFWARPDPMITDFVLPRVGEERVLWSFPIGSVMRSGGKIVFGSDWGVSTMNPLDGIQVAVTRSFNDTAGDVLMPDDRIDLASAIAAATRGVAYINFLDHVSGSIEPGKFADIVVLDRNLFEIESEQIHKTKVLLTLLQGEPVYESENWNW